MNETEIRDRVKEALGDSSYPPDLPRRLVARLEQPTKRGQPPILGFVAALLALAIVGTLVFVRLQSPTRRAPAMTPPGLQTGVVGNVVVPQFDLDQTQLSASGALVTPLNLTSNDSGRTVTLIGAYADSSRIVLFLRTLPDSGFANAVISDDSGLLNTGSEAGPGVIGDSFFILNAGPRAGSDGMAHLRVVISTFVKVLPPEPQQPPPAQERGNWTFAFALRLPASTHLQLSPPPGDVGPWRIAIEAFEVTPSLVHFQAVIDGAAVEDIKQDTISLKTPDGKSSLPTVTYEASALGTRSTRVNVSWRRPVNGDMYFLVVNGHTQGGAPINGTGTPAYIKGHPPAPTDYPASTEDITFDGAFSATVRSANPTSCGIGTGPSGTMFGLAMDFQINQAWYWIDLSTREGQYRAPGSYDVKARVRPEGGSDIFVGTVRLTVTSVNYPSPFTGTVRGTLTWTGAATEPQTVNLSGNWKCKPGEQLGPA